MNNIKLHGGPIRSLADASMDASWQPPPPKGELEEAREQLRRNAEAEDARMFKGQIVALSMPCDAKARAKEHFAAKAEGRAPRQILRKFHP